MKKYLLILLSICIITAITACGSADAGEANTEGTGENPAAGPEQNPAAGLEQNPVDPAGTEDTNTIAYRCGDIYMSIDLPPEWDYQILTAEMMAEQDGMILCGIDFWQKENPEVKLEFGYWADGIGMCGTGVTIEEVSFANGLKAWKYTETIQGNAWITIIYELELDKGAFVVQGDMPENLWKEQEAELMKLLDTVALKPKTES